MFFSNELDTNLVHISIKNKLKSINCIKISYIDVLFQSLAAGTLLYVTVSEVLPRERARWHERKRGAGLAQFLSVAVGFALMYLSTKYLGE